MVHSGLSWLALAVFVAGYALVVAEEVTLLRKSKPVMLAAGIIWILVAIAGGGNSGFDVGEAIGETMLEYAELLLFLLAAMIYVNVLEERNVFSALRSWMIERGLSLRGVFWVTGLIAFVLSSVLNNLTTALVMGAVTLSVGRGDLRFLVPACVNIVVATNAGGAFSPFGDVTTLMVWQHGFVKFGEFFDLFLPAIVNWLVPALCMQFALPRGRPAADTAPAPVKFGANVIIGLFIVTIAATVFLEQDLHLPSWFGMMCGLGLLFAFGSVIRRRELQRGVASVPAVVPEGFKPAHRPFDIFISTKRIEWDTLLFFYGVVMCVGGLGAFGHLTLLSQHSYQTLGPTVTNVGVGIASAVIDNIPIMYAVLTMHPDMSHGQWLLVTLTAGVGGSLLSIGSAAGVALMGQARGVYTFMAHFRWIWAIALGYAASIWVHFLLNARLF
jgi:Na+/H+ antiporter NhaD/arsenite permease-like protein